MNSAQAVSDWLIGRAVSRAAQKAVAEQREPVLAGPRLLPAVAVKAEPAHVVAHPVVIDEFLWQSLLGSTSQAQLAIPPGLHDASALARLAAAPAPLSGLVVSIGVSQANEQLRSVQSFILGLIRPVDFICHPHPEEFLVICPGVTGPEAQRFLSFLSERLWNFQLSSLGTSSVLFSLGGAEVEGEPLSDAIASAREKMHLTKRTRKTFLLAEAGPR